MSKTFALACRELRAYLYSPVAYAAIAIFLALTATFFLWGDFAPGRTPEMRSFFTWNMFILALVLPVLTMRLISEELSRGTIESLMTAPVTDTQVILGKFCGAVLFYLVLLLPTLAYVGLLFVYAHPEPGPIITGYLGLLLVGLFFIAVGLLASTCTRVQIVSGIIGLMFLEIMSILPFFLAQQATGWLRRAIFYTGFFWRYDKFISGTIPLVDVVFFLSGTALALFLSVKILESRKWRA